MSRWSETRLARLDAAVDQEYGDLWRFMPMRARPNAPPSPDPDRAGLSNIIATFTEYAAHVEPRGEGMYAANRVSAGISTATPCLNLSARVLGPLKLRRGDQAQRQCTGDVYEISDIQPNDDQRLVVMMKHLRREGPRA